MISQTISLILSAFISFSFLGSPNQLIYNAQPITTAKSALAFDINSQTLTYSKNIHQRLPMASLTKLMTLYIITQENDLDQQVLVSKDHTSIGGSTAYLRPNTTYSIEELIKASLLNSANEAALALAEFNAGTTEQFTKKMNQYAQKLNLKNTHFTNPIGFDDPQHYSTAYDLAKLSLEIYKNKFILNIAKQESLEITDNKNNKYQLKNTNKELNNALNLQGLKTGTTPDAGQCLIGITKGQKPTLSIILNSKNRFLDTNSLIQFTSNTL